MSQGYYLTGSFNDWQIGAQWRFAEVTSPVGVDEYGRRHGGHVAWDAYRLQLELPPGPLQFKILEGPSWDVQWTTMPFHGQEQAFDDHRFRTDCEITSGVVVARGEGMLPHAETTVAGGPTCVDFSPGARTVAFHDRVRSAAGPHVAHWRELPLHDVGAAYDTWVCLPYGYPAPDYVYPVCLVLDGRSLIYGEDPRHGRFGIPGRQWPRVFDALTRHGVIPPTVLVGVEVPRLVGEPSAAETRGRHDRHAALYDEHGRLFTAYLDSLRGSLLPALEQTFPLRGGAAGTYVLGHSWGADFALRWLARHAKDLAGVIAVSPSDPLPPVREIAVARARTRLALTYALGDLGPFFLTDGASCRQLLEDAGVPHLVHLCPGQTHTPETMVDALPAAVSFVVS